jgi:hypothetical protein
MRSPAVGDAGDSCQAQLVTEKGTTDQEQTVDWHGRVLLLVTLLLFVLTVVGALFLDPHSLLGA